ncbi:YtpI family protein [Camelliibacillus cellulosilyticus]|uniref:YtpI family protein n=1 Tax=Camelliibacillus cellulosilyticus TaxID=2174486 RepID=A0ABV9GNR3_9BACL
MPTFIILIVLSFILFLFYRIKAFRINQPYRKKWTITKAKICLGVFLIVFGGNWLFVHPSTITAVICGIFILYGIFIVIYSIKEYRFYWPRMVEEAKRQSTVNSDR